MDDILAGLNTAQREAVTSTEGCIRVIAWAGSGKTRALSYLRMIAYQDDLSFLRVANVPKRNLGVRRMKFLQEYAAENQCSLYEALRCTVGQDMFKGTKARGGSSPSLTSSPPTTPSARSPRCCRLS